MTGNETSLNQTRVFYRTDSNNYQTRNNKCKTIQARKRTILYSFTNKTINEKTK